MNAAANFAFANRSSLATRLREVLKIELGEDIKQEHYTTYLTILLKLKIMKFMENMQMLCSS